MTAFFIFFKQYLHKRVFEYYIRLKITTPMALQDTIKQLNEEIAIGGPALEKPGETKQIAPANQQTPPAPVPTPPAPAPEAAPSKTETPAQPAATKTIPKDPPFVKQVQQPTEKETPPATPAQPAAGTPAAPTPDEVPDEKFYSRLSALTDGSVKSEKEFGQFVERFNELGDIVAKGVKPVFKNERAQLVHSLLSENEGLEPQAAMRVLRAISFKPEGKSEKDILFAAYLMDPKNSDLNELDAQKYFDAEYTKKYADKENDLALQREHALAVRNATSDIAKIQNDFKAVEAPAHEANKETLDRITKAADGFGGIRLSFTDNPQETDFLNIPLEDSQEIEAIKADILDPNRAYNDLISQFDYKTEQGYQDLIRETWERKNHRMIRQVSWEDGFKKGQLAKVNEAANASNPKRIEQVGAPPAPQKESFMDAWGNAQKKSA